MRTRASVGDSSTLVGETVSSVFEPLRLFGIQTSISSKRGENLEGLAIRGNIAVADEISKEVAKFKFRYLDLRHYVISGI